MNIFLVPAPPENVEQTLIKKVDFEIAAAYLDDETARSLATELGGRLPFHCWAATEGKNRLNFEMMSAGDELLFAVTGTGRFEWRGQVKAKFVNDMLGRKLWPHEGNTGNQRKRGDKPWRYIYIVDNLEQIRLDKNLVLQGFGYENPLDVLNGLRRVSNQTTTELIARFQTLDKFLDALNDQEPSSMRLTPIRGAIRRSGSTKLLRKTIPINAPLDALQSVARSGNYRLPTYKETPALIAQVQDLFDTGGMTMHEAAARVLTPFAKSTT